jgi:CRISPR-associated endonuclease Csn1
MMSPDIQGSLTLGLDIGTNSVGWALIKKSGRKNSQIIDMGVHVFPESVTGDVAGGRYETKNATRREKRLARRQTDRRRRRRQRILKILQNAELLPNDKNLAKAIAKIDAAFLAQHGGAEISKELMAHIVPYALRRRALDHRLEKYQLGRAFYHLAQRRGFLSNRKIPQTDEDGVVKVGISELNHEMAEASARTLGEYFAGSNPEERRIRSRYTHRDMFKSEFDAIWNAQKSDHPKVLTDDLYKALSNAIFYQRRLKSQKHLIGECLFESGQKRCPWYRPEAQRFRLLQTVNNLRVVDATGLHRAVSKDERAALLKLLETSARVTCAQARKAMGITGKGVKLNVEMGKAKTLYGDKTTASLLAVFGKRWGEFSGSKKEQVILDLVSIEKHKALKKRGEKVWGLSGEALARFTELVLENDYAGLSRKAILKLLPHLESGLSYSEAVQKEYDAFRANGKVYDLLPPVDLEYSDLRNPIVGRSLTYVRRVVNSVASRYGKPERIRIELARDIKQSKQEKQRRIKDIAERTRNREKIKEQLRGYGLADPGPDDVIKIQLAEECGWVCPYTGKPIGWEDLFGPQPEFDIEHIIPFAISLDNSFLNKTLCHHHENRHVKGRRSPYQAYAGDEEKYEAILTRIKTNFRGNCKNEKLRRFKLDDLSEFEDFSNRHLNDTRYASKLAVGYLALLYGGIVDVEHKRRVQAVSGPITVIVRRWYGMTGLLGSGEKTRNDHRHHAVDAVAIALTSASTIEALSSASTKMKNVSRLAFGETVEPWNGFLHELKTRLAFVRAVHHQGRKVRGRLHEDSIFSKQPNGMVHIRKPLETLTKDDIPKIADKAVRLAVKGKMNELEEDHPQKAFANPENFPKLKRKDGSDAHVIKRVRIERKQTTVSVGSGAAERAVVGGNNHHIEIVAALDEEGTEVKWEGHVVSMLEAYRRKQDCLRRKEHPDVIKKNYGPGKLYKFSLFCGDFIELDMPEGLREVFVIRAVPQSKQIMFVQCNDARLQKEIKAAKKWFSGYPDSLRKRNARKVHLTPFGEVRNAND